MSIIPITIKHAGRTHALQVDTAASALVFKEAIHQATGVPVARMKVMVKGGMLKDDADLAKLAFKPEQVITVIGSAEPLPHAPQQASRFLEDLDDSELASSAGTPPGLLNLGNTCYLNSSLQVLRTIPEIRTVFALPPKTAPTSAARLTASFRTLVNGMNQRTIAIPPVALLSALREVAPQFAELDRSGQYAQQDADEAWTQIVSNLGATLPSSDNDRSFIDQYMAAELTQTLTCDETDAEAPSVRKEKVLKLSCNISGSTNFLLSGILESLDQKIEKTSPHLGRMASYTQKSRLSRLPVNLAVHQVRFYWRSDIQKKAKIMRKVKFPLQLDVLDLVTDDLRTKMIPINVAVKNVLKARDERAKVSKRTKQAISTAEVAETEARERNEIDKMIQDAGLTDPGCSASGLYDLSAMVTHKGASADSGHYIGWARKSDETWYKFDDDKVSEVSVDKILGLDGGGEDSVAYILLYRSVSL